MSNIIRKVIFIMLLAGSVTVARASDEPSFDMSPLVTREQSPMIISENSQYMEKNNEVLVQQVQQNSTKHLKNLSKKKKQPGKKKHHKKKTVINRTLLTV
ncbi:hypothetical protein ACTVKO_23870 [Serratia nevei]|uniref:hypothetical protein n=1 Tax=Serratia nevei TaxID=2703794 RepID=UPI003FA6B439